jgi:hypothetical protein
MALADDILTTINASLLANLDWLDTAFGKCQKLQKYAPDGKTKINYPGIYIGNASADYVNLLPDQTIGNNYSYIDVISDIDYENIGRHITPKFKFKIVFWFYWPDVYADWQSRSIEEVKAQVLNVLTATSYTGTIEIFSISEDAKSIYAGYTHQEIEKQFLERPYGGFAVECEVQGVPACSISLPTPTIPVNLFGLLPMQYSTSEQVHPILKWLDGSTVYWRTWSLGTGADDFETLSGILVDEVGVILHSSSHTCRNTVSGTWTTIGVELEEVSGGYKILTRLSTDNNYVTLFYTKA